MSYEGKVVKDIQIAVLQYLNDRAKSVVIKLTDGTSISICPAMGQALIVNVSKEI